MADNSYFELLEARVELNLSDFRQKMMMADAELDLVAASPNVTERGEGFTAAGDAMIDAAIDQMNDFVAEVMVRSRVQVPKDTEVLMNSARPNISETGLQEVTPEDELVSPRLNGNRVTVTFGYGYGEEQNPKTGRLAGQYALPVHEIYEAKHDPPTKSHFLIDPLLEKAPQFGPDLKLAMQGAEVQGRVSNRVYLFRPGGGPGIPAVFGPGGVMKRRRA